MDSDAAGAPAATARADDPDPCHAAAVRGLIGHADGAALRAAVARAVGQTHIRWIRPGDPVTEDYSPARLNLMIDEAGKLESARCG